MYDKEKADYAVAFFSCLKHTKGEFANKPFVLLPWQEKIIRDVYGTVKENGYRQYKYVYIELPKKNGKTELAAGAALYHTYADGEINGEVYGCAAEKDQASLAFDVATQMRDLIPPLKKRSKLIASKKMLIDNKSGTFYKVLSAEAFSKHGLNVSACIFDELHAQPNRDLWDVMTFGAGDARAQPIWWVITTAGDDPDRTSIGWEIHEKASKILSGEIVDPSWYVVIYGSDESEDPFDMEVIKRCNPSLGFTIGIDKIEEAIITAKTSEVEERKFRWLRLNQWLKNKLNASWLSFDYWDKLKRDWTIEELYGEECYGMLDLSSTADITTLGLLFPPCKKFNEWRAIWETWIPEIGMKQRVKNDGVPYDQWHRQGWIRTTPGDCIDYQYIRERTIANSKLFKLKECGFDKYFASQLSLELQADKIKMIEVPQLMKTLAPATIEVERLIMTEKLTHNGNPVARWCFGNVKMKYDENGNKRPVKENSKQRIDLMIGLVGAMARALPHQMKKKSVYAERGVVVI